MLHLRGLVTALAIACGYVALIVAIGLLSLPVRSDELIVKGPPLYLPPSSYGSQACVCGDGTADARCCDPCFKFQTQNGWKAPPDRFCETRCVEYAPSNCDCTCNALGACSCPAVVCLPAPCLKRVRFCGEVLPDEEAKP